jgi:hypothetical protein
MRAVERSSSLDAQGAHVLRMGPELWQMPTRPATMEEGD